MGKKVARPAQGNQTNKPYGWGKNGSKTIGRDNVNTGAIKGLKAVNNNKPRGYA